MDRWLIVATALVIGCGGDALQRSGTGQPLPPKAIATRHPSGMMELAVPARGVLTYAVALSADGSRLVAVELDTAFRLVTREIDARGRVRERARITLGAATYDIHDLAIDPRATRAWVASADGTARSIDLLRGKVLRTWRLGEAVTAIAVSPDRRFVAVGTASGIICLRRSSDGALLQCLLAHTKRVSALSFAPIRPTLLASGSWDGTAALWEVPSLRRRAKRRSAGSINDLAFHPRDLELALARSAAPPVRSPAVAARERHHSFESPSAAWIEIWRPGAAKARRCHGHRSAVTAVAFSSTGQRVFSAAWDRSAILWDPSTCRQLARITGFKNLVRDLSVDARGRYLAIAAWSQKLEDRATVLVRLLY